MVWGSSAGRSCDGLLDRVERNDPTLTELVVLPLKKFGSIDLKRIAEAIQNGQNTHLTSLQASGHHIDDMDALEKFGFAISSRGQTNQLVNITIGDSELGEDGVVAFCRGLAAGTTATSSDGSDDNNACNDDDETIEQSNNEIRIHNLDLSYKGMGRLGLTSLLEAMGRQSSLQILDLSRNDCINEMDLHSWLMERNGMNQGSRRPIGIFPRLQNLDLSYCGLDPSSSLSWLVALHEESKNSNMTLKLNGNDARDNDDEEDDENTKSNFKEFTEYFATNSSRYVQELQMSKCNLGDDELKLISDYWFTSMSSSAPNQLQERFERRMQTLDFSQNSFTVDGLNYLATSLIQQVDVFGHNEKVHQFPVLQNLQTINFSGNHLNDEACAKFADAIIQSKKIGYFHQLQHLDLSKTNCGVNAAVKLIDECQLTNLNLFGNRLGSDSFLTISKVLTGGHTSLHTLDVGGNDVSEAGVVALLQAFLSPCPSEGKENSLRLLVVGGNKSGPTVESVVQEIKKIHPDLDIARDKPKRNHGAAGPF
jgi:Leucine Rich repeat